MTRARQLNRAELNRHPLPSLKAGDKDRHGRIFIVAGSREVPGAGLLAAHGAMRAGAGKLHLAVPEDVAAPIGVAMPEAMVTGYSTGADGGFTRSAVKAIVDGAQNADAVVAGPGMVPNGASKTLSEKLCGAGAALAFDAALLHVLRSGRGRCRSAGSLPILLPHAGEMASLLNCSAEEVEADPLVRGQECARHYRAAVLVKGVRSFVVMPDGEAWRYDGGAPGLGVSGSGDVLAGVVGGLLARGAGPLSALIWAVWLHGEAGRKLSSSVGSIGFLAREIAGEIPALLADCGSEG